MLLCLPAEACNADFIRLKVKSEKISPFIPLLCLQERAAADNCRELNEQEGGAHDAGGSPIDAFAWGSIVLGKQLDISSEFDRRLSIGASIACRLRGAIRKHLGDCSIPGMLRGWHLAGLSCQFASGCRDAQNTIPQGFALQHADPLVESSSGVHIKCPHTQRAVTRVGVSTRSCPGGSALSCCSNCLDRDLA